MTTETLAMLAKLGAFLVILLTIVLPPLVRRADVEGLPRD